MKKGLVQVDLRAVLGWVGAAKGRFLLRGLLGMGWVGLRLIRNGLAVGLGLV